MIQWEIYDYPIPSEEEPHPFVIISSRIIYANERINVVNALMCTTIRPQAPLKEHQVVLDIECAAPR